MKRHLVLLPLLLFTAAASAQSVPNDGNFAWTVPTSPHLRIGCWEYNGFSVNDDEGGSGTMLVVARMRGGNIASLHGYDAACAPKTDAQRLSLSVDQSIDFLTSQADGERVIAVLALHESPRIEPLLEKLAGRGSPSDVREQAVFWLGQRGGEAGFRFLRDLIHDANASRELTKKAVFSISQSKGGDATAELIDVARHHESSDVRRDALFWLGQKAGAKAAAELRRAVDEDPDDDVREHAVFAISQLPRDRSVPLLIDLVKHHKSAKVREKAMFWLAQTNDPRALDLIEEILTH